MRIRVEDGVPVTDAGATVGDIVGVVRMVIVASVGLPVLVGAAVTGVGANVGEIVVVGVW